MLAIKEYTEQDNQFYPTPEPLVREIAEDIDWTMIKTVLEPSAGKGDIVKALQVYLDERKWNYSDTKEYDCIEVDPHLRAIIKDTCKKVYIVHDDFLTFDSYKKYDLVIMNPPFKNGDIHLLKAIEMQEKWGGSIVCILNAETIRNAYTETRKMLLQKLEEYGATIKYKNDAFCSAERKTGVEIAIIKLFIPPEKRESEIYKRMQEAEQYEQLEENECYDIEITDIIKQAVSQYKVEVRSSVELIKQFRALKPYIQRNLNDDSYNSSILRLIVGDSRCDDDVNINEYIKKVRSKYWCALLRNEKLMGKFTSELRRKYNDMIDELVNYEFSEYNINRIMLEANAEIKSGVENAIIKLFDTLTVEHSWYPECKNNRHYYDGWKTNIAHKVGKKSIVPACGVFESTWRYAGKVYGGDKLKVYDAYSFLSDLEKAFNYLDGNMTADVDLMTVIEQAKENPKNIQCKFFKVTFYKKGTCHITYTNQKLVDKLNIYAAKNRKWLPPHYGKTAYKDMTAEEKQVIDAFQGEQAYNEVMRNKDYYLNISTSNVLQIAMEE